MCVCLMMCDLQLEPGGSYSLERVNLDDIKEFPMPTEADTQSHAQSHAQSIASASGESKEMSAGRTHECVSTAICILLFVLVCFRVFSC